MKSQFFRSLSWTSSCGTTTLLNILGNTGSLSRARTSAHPSLMEIPDVMCNLAGRVQINQSNSQCGSCKKIDCWSSRQKQGSHLPQAGSPGRRGITPTPGWGSRQKLGGSYLPQAGGSRQKETHTYPRLGLQVEGGITPTPGCSSETHQSSEERHANRKAGQY